MYERTVFLMTKIVKQTHKLHGVYHGSFFNIFFLISLLKVVGEEYATYYKFQTTPT